MLLTCFKNWKSLAPLEILFRIDCCTVNCGIFPQQKSETPITKNKAKSNILNSTKLSNNCMLIPIVNTA